MRKRGHHTPTRMIEQGYKTIRAGHNENIDEKILSMTNQYEAFPDKPGAD